jgi:hypothetical protein
MVRYCSSMGMSLDPNAAFTVRISRSPTLPTARAWLVRLPETATVTSRSMIEPAMANDRYCAAAHTTGRSQTASIAATAAPRPQPPKRNFSRVAMPSVIGRYQRIGLWVGVRPRNSVASMRSDPRRPGRVRRTRHHRHGNVADAPDPWGVGADKE